MTGPSPAAAVAAGSGSLAATAGLSFMICRLLGLAGPGWLVAGMAAVMAVAGAVIALEISRAPELPWHD